MFSIDNFYTILHTNLIEPLPADSFSLYFTPFGTYDNCEVVKTYTNNNRHNQKYLPPAKKNFIQCNFFDQEPFYKETESIADTTITTGIINWYVDGFDAVGRINIIATSEKSTALSEYVKSKKIYNWYYFFHGFAALDWYGTFIYAPPAHFNRFDKVFICYNHLTSKYRSYRLHLVSNLIEQDLIKHGYVSLFADNWKQTIADPESPLDTRARIKIYQTLKMVKLPLTVDTDNPHGGLSATVRLDDLTKALFHIVTETVYFHDKLHLTEKIFKPIVARRPFFLVAAPGNLAYLKSYGFRTFDRWIDESYDTETDHYIRIEKITAELARLCTMDPSALEQMYLEMQEVLEYNFNHFYGDFKKIIVNELVDNFEHILNQINHGRQPNNHSRYHKRYDLLPQYLDDVKQRLSN